MNKIVKLLIIFLFFYSKSFSQDLLINEDSLLNRFTLEWIGKPYKLGGSTKKGIDCSQFNKKLYEYVYNLELDNVCYLQYRQTERVSYDELQKGDLLFFRSKASPSGWHCAVYLGDDKFIHASNHRTGVIISELSEPNYRKKFKSGGRI